MTHPLLRSLSTLVLLAACTGGGVDGTDPATGPGTTPSVSDTGDGTQVGGEGTEPTTTCMPAEGLPLDTAFDDGTTVADALGGLGEPIGPVTWFDGRGAAVELVAVVDGSVRIDAYCHHLVEVLVQVESDDGAVVVDDTVTLSVSSGYASGRVDQEAASWAGSLDEVDVIGEACVEGAVWRTLVRWIDGVPTGEVTVRCNPWSGAEGGDGTTPIDTGLTDTGSGTDTDAGGTSTLTGTTTAPNTGGHGDDQGDPQLGFSQDVVSW